MAAETSDGGGRRQRAAFDGGSGRRSVPETGPKQRTQGRQRRPNRGRQTVARWTPAGATVEAAGSGSATGWQQRPGAGDRRRREEAETEEADGEGKGGVSHG